MKTTNQISDDLSALSETSNEVLKQKRDSILGKLPEYIKDYIEECFKYKRIPKEYQLASILYSIATASGSTFFTNQMNYTNYSNIYIMIFGNRSDGKSEGIKMATKELVKQDDKYYEDYEIEKLNNDEKHKPILKQILVKDSSIEALKLNHYKCPNGIGIMIDEIRSLLINMNISGRLKPIEP